MRDGRRTITHQEIVQAKRSHRKALQQAVRGDLPTIFSQGARYAYLGTAVLFAIFTGIGWHAYAAAGARAGEKAFWMLIAATVATGIMLLFFLFSFAGKRYQRESAAELRGILQAGEFAPPEGESQGS